jgi:cytochrome c biogenesis protein CcdA
VSNSTSCVNREPKTPIQQRSHRLSHLRRSREDDKTEILVDLQWRAFPASFLMAIGAILAVWGTRLEAVGLRDIFRQSGGALALVTGFRTTIFGLALLGVGAAWRWHLMWLLILSACYRRRGNPGVDYASLRHTPGEALERRPGTVASRLPPRLKKRYYYPHSWGVVEQVQTSKAFGILDLTGSDQGGHLRGRISL